MVVPIFNKFIELVLKYFWPQPVEQLSFKLISIEKHIPSQFLNNLQMNQIIWIINPSLVTPADCTLDVDSKGSEKPMPHPFNWCVVYAAHL